MLAPSTIETSQASQAPSCEAFYSTLRSARRVIEVEIPAYCAELKVAVAHGEDRGALLRDYALRISAQSGAMENRLDVLTVLRQRCEDGS